jgi:hypothetical protein
MHVCDSATTGNISQYAVDRNTSNLFILESEEVA